MPQNSSVTSTSCWEKAWIAPGMAAIIIRAAGGKMVMLLSCLKPRCGVTGISSGSSSGSSSRSVSYVPNVSRRFSQRIFRFFVRFWDRKSIVLKRECEKIALAPVFAPSFQALLAPDRQFSSGLFLIGVPPKGSPKGSVWGANWGVPVAFVFDAFFQA